MKMLGLQTWNQIRQEARRPFRQASPAMTGGTPSEWRANFQNAGARERLTRRVKHGRSGLTLIELIVAFTILLILSTMALPLANVKVQREKERRLRDALTEMRKAIDRYKDAADAGKITQLDPDAHGYPPSLEVLVEGVPMQGGGLPGSAITPPGGQNPGQPGGAFGNQSRGGFGSQSRSGFGSQSRSGFGSQSRSGLGGQTQGGFGGPSRGGFGSQSTGVGSGDEEQKIRFLRRIPVDPMTNSTDWGLRSVQDDPDSMSWGGQNVFDVYTKSTDTALDGTKYQEW